MSSQSSLPRTKKKIRPPTTTLDDGQPTKSCKRDIDRVLRLIEDERHFTAQELLHDIQDRLGIVRNGATDGKATTEKNPSSPQQSQTSNEDSGDSNNPTGRHRGKMRLRPFQFNRHHQQQKKNNTETSEDHEETKAILEANQGILDTLEVCIAKDGSLFVQGLLTRMEFYSCWCQFFSRIPILFGFFEKCRIGVYYSRKLNKI